MKIGIEVELGVFRVKRPVVCDFLPYTKERPLDVAGNMLHKDASMLEMAMRPCISGEDMDNVYAEALEAARILLPKGVRLEAIPALVYSDEELAKDAYASVLGCSPSLSIYDNEEPMPEEYPDNTRYAGMHVNISSDDHDINDMTVLALDANLGLRSVVECEQEHKDAIVRRRTMYGRAGEHRYPPFGVEYRTLPSSTWQHWGGEVLFERVRAALNMNTDKLVPIYSDIQRAINTCDAVLAEDLLQTIHN